MTDLFTIAADVQAFFDSKKWKFCFIGGLAVQQWGEPRMTRDVDLTLLTGFENEVQFIDAILLNYSSRISDARQFALSRRIILLEKHTIGIDISLGGFPFEEEMIARSKIIEINTSTHLRFCTAEDLIILKAYADRPIDWQDIEGVILRQRNNALDWPHIEGHLAELAELKDSPELVTKLLKLRDALKT